jgi:hypothetical protein
MGGWDCGVGLVVWLGRLKWNGGPLTPRFVNDPWTPSGSGALEDRSKLSAQHRKYSASHRLVVHP